jgi:RimJ/RimL family protein N-acetyltransferase
VFHRLILNTLVPSHLLNLTHTFISSTIKMENLFRSPRLIYRAIEDTPEDEAFIHSIQSDIVAFANSDTGLLVPMTKAESKKYKNKLVEKALLATIICLALPLSNPVVTTPPVPIGCISLKGIDPGQARHRNTFISIDITAPYQRKGYGSEAIEWVLDWGFRIAGLHRIGIECFSFNDGAKQLYERLGFVYEGAQREALWFNGGWHDYVTFGMLEGEWKARQEKKLLEKVTKKD